MAVLKSRKQNGKEHLTRTPERPVQQRTERSTVEEVPIHVAQRPLQRPPTDMRDPRMRPPQPPRPRRGLSIRMMLSIGIALLLCAALIYILTRGDSTTVIEQKKEGQTPISGQELAQTTSTQATVDPEKILTGLRKHILLPDGTPQMMQINNPDELIQKDAFFKGSETGDVLLIYREAGKALVYSPQRDIIVNVGPVQVDAPGASPSAERTQ